MKVWLVILFAFSAAAASGDVVRLHDGSVLDGQVRRTADGYVVTTVEGKTTVVSATDVQSIELRKSASSDTPGQQFESLQRLLDNTSDPKLAAQRCREFIAQHPGTPLAEKASRVLAVWQERVDGKMVRSGSRWLTPQEVKQQAASAGAAARLIAPLVAQQQWQMASASLLKALADAPADPGLLYLAGLVRFEQGKLRPAREAFEKVVKALPDDAPAHNNLAVVFWKIHALMPAMSEYEKAMMAEPASRRILDNVAEALHALPQNARKNAVVVRVLDLFQAQDADLQTRMAKDGLHRAGATWISEEEYQKRLADQKAAASAQDNYENQLLTLQSRIAEIDRKIDSDMGVLNAMKQEQTAINPFTGQTTGVELPPRYDDLEAEVARLKAERIQKQRQLDQLPKALEESRQPTATHDYRGKQRMIGVSGTPGLEPTTQPATQPS